MDERFNLAQHPVDADGELVERVIAPAGRQALAQIAGNDTLDFPVDVRQPIESPQAQHHSDANRQGERRQQAEPQGPADDFRDLFDLAIASANRQHFAARQRVNDESYVLCLAALPVEPNDRGVGRDIGRKADRETLQIAGDAMSVGPEQARDPDATGIITQSIYD
jgi:hypothetical protein